MLYSGESPPITDLRSALERLRHHQGQLIETDGPVDPVGELAGVYRRIGAGGTVERPTRIGPAMLFNSVAGCPGARVLVGLMASRRRVGILLETPPDRLTQRMAQAYDDATGPVDYVDHTLGRALDQFGIHTDLFPRWDHELRHAVARSGDGHE